MKLQGRKTEKEIEEKRQLTKYFSSGPKLKKGQSRILPRNEAQDYLVVIVGLGKKDQSLESQREGHDLAREAIRTSISIAVRSLKIY